MYILDYHAAFFEHIKYIDKSQEEVKYDRCVVTASKLQVIPGTIRPTYHSPDSTCLSHLGIHG